MCSIGGLLFKHGKRPDSMPFTTGKCITEILDGTVHRGPDSCGWGLYREACEGEYRMRFFINEDDALEAREDVVRIQEALIAEGAEILEEKIVGCMYAVKIKYAGNIEPFTVEMGAVAEIVSVGSSLDSIKDVGKPYEVCTRHDILDFDGTHGLGHTRLATESGVHPNTSHPFWAPGFSDVCTVHNGQLTNYWIMRRRLERRGMRFQTKNDTELIAVYLAYQMSQGATLEDALKTSLDELDGTYTYMVATKDSVGYAKDKLAAKPMVIYEDDDLIAIASEEVGINRLFPGKALVTREPPPLTYGIWSV
jgi:methylamine---glutamate N-methyltransferase subunit A